MAWVILIFLMRIDWCGYNLIKKKQESSKPVSAEQASSRSPAPIWDLLRRIRPARRGRDLCLLSSAVQAHTRTQERSSLLPAAARRPARHRPPRPRGCDDRPVATDDPAGARTFVCVGAPARPAQCPVYLSVGIAGWREPVVSTHLSHGRTHVTCSPVCPLRLMMASTGVNKAHRQ